MKMFDFMGVLKKYSIKTITYPFKVFVPDIKGFIGETIVASELNRLPGEEYRILNDVLISWGRGSSQIDHIVVPAVFSCANRMHCPGSVSPMRGFFFAINSDGKRQNGVIDWSVKAACSASLTRAAKYRRGASWWQTRDGPLPPVLILRAPRAASG